VLLLIIEKIYNFCSLPKHIAAAKLKRNSSERRKSSMSLSLSMGVNITSPVVTLLGIYFPCITNRKFKLCSYLYNNFFNEIYFFSFVSKNYSVHLPPVQAPPAMTVGGQVSHLLKENC
jgi:hypothetical protein